MDALRKREIIDLVKGVAFAVCFSFPFSFFMHMGVSPFVTALCFGLPFGINMGLASAVIMPRLRHRTFILTTVAHLLTFLLVICGSFVVAFWLLIGVGMGKGLFTAETKQLLLRIMLHLDMAWSVGASLVMTLIISGIYQVSRKLGPGVLRNWVLGRYHNPREEDRIFMFLDMRDSTTLAEKLGNLKFSALVRDFFRDLTRPLVKTQGEISHYVGDEAVLCWPIKKGVKDANCVRLFFLMQEEIEKRRDYYLSNYGVVPGFKAGLHVGLVVATEVGEIKSEIVFHGDVLNTAARIQGMCNGFGHDCLISGELRALLDLPSDLESQSLGRHLLKGKEHDVEIFQVCRAGESPLPLQKEPEAAKVETASASRD